MTYQQEKVTNELWNSVTKIVGNLNGADDRSIQLLAMVREVEDSSSVKQVQIITEFLILLAEIQHERGIKK